MKTGMLLKTYGNLYNLFGKDCTWHVRILCDKLRKKWYNKNVVRLSRMAVSLWEPRRGNKKGAKPLFSFHSKRRKARRTGRFSCL